MNVAPKSALEAYRLIAGRAAMPAPAPRRRRALPTKERRMPVAGEAFGELVAIEQFDVDREGFVRWVFECACGRRLVSRLAPVWKMVARGYCACPACYHRDHPRSEDARPASADDAPTASMRVIG